MTSQLQSERSHERERVVVRHGRKPAAEARAVVQVQFSEKLGGIVVHGSGEPTVRHVQVQRPEPASARSRSPLPNPQSAVRTLRFKHA